MLARSAQTLLDRLWSAHEIHRNKDGASLLWVDRHFVHEGSHHAFAKLAARGAKVAEPNLTFGVVDHYAPTQRQVLQDPSALRMMQTLRDNTAAHGLRLFDLNDADQGIVHVIGPEQGLTLPGLLINCGDSHTSTHGAFGALAFGIGATEVAHVLASQTIWQVEYAGSAVRALSMEGRMTLCNLTIEGGGRFGMIAPDEVTLSFVKHRPFAPRAALWQQAQRDWAELVSGDDARFDREVTFAAKDIAPTVTWGTSPEHPPSLRASVQNQSETRLITWV